MQKRFIHLGADVGRQRRAARWGARWAGVLVAAAGTVLAVAAVAAGGCGETDDGAAGDVRTARAAGAGRLDAAWGSVVVVPARSLPLRDAGQIDPAAIRARTDDGQGVEIEWRVLRVAPGESPAMPPTGRRGWMPPVGAWSTAPVVGAEAGEDGEGTKGTLAAGEVSAAFAVLTLPQGTLGQGVWMEGSGVGDGVGDGMRGVRLEVNWLPSSVSMAERSGGTGTGVFDAPLTAEEAGSGLVRAALEDESRSPFRRWRARLARGLLRPTESAESPRGAEPDGFEDTALEEIAAQIEERWTVALALLAEADAGMAARVKRTLVLTAPLVGDGGPAERAPVWTTDQSALDALLEGLLAPRATRGARMMAAEHFLRAVPEAVARVADDAHALDAGTLAPVVVIAVTNLTERPQAASAVWPRTLMTPELLPVAPGSSARLVMPTDAETVAARPTAAWVAVGDWRGRVAASPAAAGVIPPGLFLGPMARDLSKDEWLASAAGSAAAAPPLAVTIIRTPSPNPRERSDSEGWVLYGESAAGVEGVLRVWLGPASGSRESLPIVIGAASAVEEGAAPVTKRTFSMPVPPEAVTRGRLVIGLEASVSVAGAESHWAWPRAMFPWQRSPSRAALDLSAWGGVSTPAGPR